MVSCHGALPEEAHDAVTRWLLLAVCSAGDQELQRAPATMAGSAIAMSELEHEANRDAGDVDPSKWNSLRAGSVSWTHKMARAPARMHILENISTNSTREAIVSCGVGKLFCYLHGDVDCAAFCARLLLNKICSLASELGPLSCNLIWQSCMHSLAKIVPCS